MNSFTPPDSLPFLSQLKTERESKVNSLINNLKIADVQSDEAFKNTTIRIKKNILLTPVVFGQPKFVDHEYEERPLNFNQQVVGIGSPHHYNHEVSIPFTGDSELFKYRNEGGFTYSSSDRGVIMPNGSEIIVFVDLPQLNPTLAEQQTSNLLGMTYQIVNHNNADIKVWSAQRENIIDAKLKEKREELIRVFVK